MTDNNLQSSNFGAQSNSESPSNSTSSNNSSSSSNSGDINLSQESFGGASANTYNSSGSNYWLNDLNSSQK